MSLLFRHLIRWKYSRCHYYSAQSKYRRRRLTVTEKMKAVAIYGRVAKPTHFMEHL